MDNNLIMNLEENKQNLFEIYNKSSEKMSEIKDDSIDLIIADPPWGLGVKYGNLVDKPSHEKYSQMMKKIILEIKRVLKSEGLVIFILPKVVRKINIIYDYNKEFTNLFQELNFFKIQTFDFLVHEDDFTCLSVKEIIGQGRDCHSEEIQGIVFSKFNIKTKNFPKNKYYVYASREGHPCPYPIELINDLLDTFYNKKNKVLDPFMGTGSLGLEVIKRNGQFFGYELNKDYFKTAEIKMGKFCKSL